MHTVCNVCTNSLFNLSFFVYSCYLSISAFISIFFSNFALKQEKIYHSKVKLNKVDTNRFYIGKKQIDKDEAVNKIHKCRKSELFCLLVNTK